MHEPTTLRKSIFVSIDRKWLIELPVCRSGYRTLALAVVVVMSGLFISAGSAHAQTLKCLPPDINAETIVGSASVRQKDGSMVIRSVTVRETLKKIKARCLGTKLVDQKCREIRFFVLQGCWGNPPADYMEILDDQKKEIHKLKKKFTVIEVGCVAGEQTVLSAPPTRP